MNTVGWCLAWVGGSVAGLLTVEKYSMGIEPIYGQGLLLVGAMCAVPMMLGWTDKRLRHICIISMAALGGCGSALLLRPPITPLDLAYYNSPESGPDILVVGVVRSEPVFTDRSQRLIISAELVRPSGESIPRPAKGDLYAVVPRYPERELGARLSLSGTLTPPLALSDFDYPAYLARQGIFSYMVFPTITHLGVSDSGFLSVPISFARSRLRDALQRAIPEPQASIAVGVITGDRSQIPEGVQEAFRRSGTMHIIAISGQNIALLTGVVWLFYSASSRRRMTVLAFLCAAGLIVTYTIFTGATPSVVRAAIMGIILLLAPIVHRRYDPIGAIAVTATSMVIVDPDLLADLGFQLSFAAMIGLALLAPPLYSVMKRWHIPTVFALPVAASLAAQAGTLPILALTNGQISTVSLPATLIAGVALLPLMATGIATGVLGAIVPPLAIPLGLLAWPFAAWLIWWAEAWASLPFASVDASALNPVWVIIYYSVLAIVVWLLNKAQRQPLAMSDLMLAGSLSAALALWAIFAAIVVS